MIPLSPEFQPLLLTTNQLRALPCLPALKDMINEAYLLHHKGFRTPDSRPRFGNEQELVNALAPPGRCCVMLQSQDEGQAARPVACAMLKVYHEGDPPADSGVSADVDDGVDGADDREDGEGVDISSIHDWEVGVVAVLQDPKLRKLGLAMRCMEVLERDLLERIKRGGGHSSGGSVPMQNDGLSSPGDQEASQPLNFWLMTSKSVNEAYWKRRGYETVKEKVFPKGHWGHKEEFTIAWMKKVVPRNPALTTGS
ncbi:hypothetical protein FQN50_008309 [Emmonsiellopsis sp. PD_5]|nr:hypothetical protein FQN50_008309 [Emmonsiellopsis sp. PD_5]